MFEEAKSTLSQLKFAEKPKKSKIEWISERTRSKFTNIRPFCKSCCGFPVWATLKVDVDSEHSVHKVFLIFYGSTTLLFSERTLNGWEQGPFMPKDHVNRGSRSKKIKAFMYCLKFYAYVLKFPRVQCSATYAGPSMRNPNEKILPCNFLRRVLP